MEIIKPTLNDSTNAIVVLKSAHELKQELENNNNNLTLQVCKKFMQQLVNEEKLTNSVLLLKNFGDISTWLKEQEKNADKENVNMSEEVVTIQTNVLISILKECRKMKSENGAGVEVRYFINVLINSFAFFFSSS